MGMIDIPINYRGDMSDDDVLFAEGLAAARPLDDLAAELGWTIAKARKKAKSANVLALAAAEGLAMVHGVLVPQSLDLLSQFIRGRVEVSNYSEDGQLLKSYEKVPPAVRLQAAQTVLKIAALEEVNPPKKDAEDLSAASPGQLRALMDMIEAQLGDLAKPVNAPRNAKIPNEYNVLD